MNQSPSPDELTDRLTAVRQHLAAWDIPAILITQPTNRRWLSGFTGSAGSLLVSADHALLATDSRYWEQAQAEAPAFRLVRHNRTDEDNLRFLTAVAAATIGLEADHITLSEADRLKTIESITWVPISPSLETLRYHKTAGELAHIRAAAAITDQVMDLVPQVARPGMTERALAWELEKAMREAGAEGTAFDIIVAGGPNAALPHHHPGERPLQPNEPLLVDMGAQVNGYKSDLTRTFFLGAKPDAQFQAIYDVVQAAQTAVRQHAHPSQNGNQVDALAREVIQQAGYGENFGHGLGHGLGLDIHEGPFFTFTPNGQRYSLAVGMVVTVEPGIYLPGWGGVRLEDLFLVTETGLEAISQCAATAVITVAET
ncbi:MAG: aminopeptidase P family protein [Chloroflexi bacterium]|nr:aminopeptidase P family protein [Chloroflexota bacterium]MBP7044638.1 aminopeptidase P family protein [Chloroflexota bacterium]